MRLSPLFAATIALLSWSASAASQTNRQLYATRSSLEERTREAERSAGDASIEGAMREQKRAEALEVRYRLEHGDFRPGDRIIVATVIEQSRSDTLVVAGDQSISIGGFPSLSLRGVLRSELDERLRGHLATFVRNPRVTAKPLVRLAVTGRVGRPGFYNVPADALLTDVIMVAGGPAADADISKSVVRRDREELRPSKTVRVAINEGFSVDSFDLRPGDELVIGAQGRKNWESIIRNTGVVVGLVSLFYTVR